MVPERPDHESREQECQPPSQSPHSAAQIVRQALDCREAVRGAMVKNQELYRQQSSYGANMNSSADPETLFFHHSVELCHLLAEALALSIHVLV